MKIKELREIIRDLPDDMDVVVLRETHRDGTEIMSYHASGSIVTRARIKNTRKVTNNIWTFLIQTRPMRDDEATKALIIE